MTFPKSAYKVRRAQTQLKFRGPRPSLSSESVYSSVLGYPQLKINVIDMCDELDAYWGASLQEIAEATTGSCSPRYDKQKANEHLKAVEDPATFGIWRQGATSNAARLFLGSKRTKYHKRMDPVYRDSSRTPWSEMSFEVLKDHSATHMQTRMATVWIIWITSRGVLQPAAGRDGYTGVSAR